MLAGIVPRLELEEARAVGTGLSGVVAGIGTSRPHYGQNPRAKPEVGDGTVECGLLSRRDLPEAGFGARSSGVEIGREPGTGVVSATEAASSPPTYSPSTLHLISMPAP